MINLTDQMFEGNQITAIPSTGMMTPTTTTCHSLNQELQQPTLTILVSVRDQRGAVRKDVQVKMRYLMSFGKLAALLRTMFGQSESFGLAMQLEQGRVTLSEYAHIFDSDTPASLKLEGRTKLVFRKPDFEAIDMSRCD